MHYTATAIPFIYSFSGNCTASAPISTFMCLWAFYIPHIASSTKGRPIVGIYNSLTDTWMWKLGLRPQYSCHCAIYTATLPLTCTAKAIPFIYSFSGNCLASAPISTFMCLWAIYIFPGSVHIFPSAETAAPSWEYIIRSQTHECGNWDWGPDIPFLGIFVSNFRHFVCAVQASPHSAE